MRVLSTKVENTQTDTLRSILCLDAGRIEPDAEFDGTFIVLVPRAPLPTELG